MAFKVGTGGVTVVSHDGKLNNDNQWPGDPVKLGAVDSDVTLNFDSDETTNYRMTYFPRTHSLPDVFTLRFAQGIWDSDRSGDNIPNRYFPFVPNIIGIDAPQSVTTSQVSDPTKRSEFIKKEIYGDVDVTTYSGDAVRAKEHFYPYGLKAITTSKDDYVVVAGRFSSNASGNINPTDYLPDAGVSLDSSFVQVFDKDGKLVDTINDPSNSPGSTPTRKKYLARHIQTKYVWRDYGTYGLWPYSQPPIDNYNNLLFLGNPNYLDSAGVNGSLEGKVFVYDLNTKQFVDSIGPKKITDDQERFGDYISIDSNRMAISSDEAIYLYKLDSSDPYKPYHIIEDSAQDGYNDRFDNRYYRDHFMNVKMYQSYAAVGRPNWSHRSSSSTPLRINIGQFFIFDSAGKELYNYFDSDIPANNVDVNQTFLGSSICWAPYDSSRSRHGAIFVGAPGDLYAWPSYDDGPRGLVYKFNFNLNTNTFSFGGKIRPTGGFKSQYTFGHDIVADPNRDLLLIGAPFDSSTADLNYYNDLPMGAIYAYNYNSGSLTNQTQILDKTSIEEYISGSGRLGKEVDNDINNFFGGSIDLHRRPKNNRTFTTNSMTLKRPIGLANNVGQSGSILIQKRIDGTFGCDSEGFVTFDSCWWFPGGAEVDSAKRMNSLTPLLGSSFVTKDMLNYYVFDSDKIFCSWQKDLR